MLKSKDGVLRMAEVIAGARCTARTIMGVEVECSAVQVSIALHETWVTTQNKSERLSITVPQMISSR
jgi:hypothetical protein